MPDSAVLKDRRAFMEEADSALREAQDFFDRWVRSQGENSFHYSAACYYLDRATVLAELAQVAPPSHGSAWK